MIKHLRYRLRIVIATTICTLVATPALIGGSASIAAAAPPGAATGVLTVGGQGTGLASNPWHFDGSAYTQLKLALANTDNFGPTGTFTKGRYSIAPTITTDLTFPGTLSGLDVFFGALPPEEYDASEIAALQAFNADGRALVLNSNTIGFGEVATFLGFNMRDNRAFFGNEPACNWSFPSEHAPSASSASAPTHEIVDGPFGTASTVTNYHTVQAFTSPLPAHAQSLYSLSVSNQAPQFTIIGPIGQWTDSPTPPTLPTTSAHPAVVSGLAIINTAALTPSAITRVDFYRDDATASVPANLLGTTTAPGPFDLAFDTAGLTEGVHSIYARVTPVAPFTSFVVEMDHGLDVDNALPVNNPPPAGTTVSSVDHSCAGSYGEVVDNNISGTTVAVIPAKALSANSGPIIVTSDLDSMSNAFNDPEGSWTRNDTFTLNAFAWIMDEIIPDYVPPPPPPPTPDQTYFPLSNPVRVYDSREHTALVHQQTRLIQVAGVGGVPADAKTVVANVTVVDPDSSGYLTVFPGPTRPDTSTHNFGAGENFANMVTMQVGSGGYISVYDFLDAGTGTVDVLVDIVGYTRADNAGTRLHTMAPTRVLDTRAGIGLPKAPFGPGVAQNLTVRGGTTGVPSDAESVVLNMTVTNATRTGSFVTVWPSGPSPKPVVSNLNNVEGIARPNLVVARIGAGGQISIVNDSGTADIIADVVGYFSAGAYGSGGVITGLTPARIVNTRVPSNPFDEGDVRSFTVAGVGGIPANAKTAILKVTAVDPTNEGFLTVWPAGTTAPPTASNLNFGPHMTIPNLVVTQIGTAGQINIFNAFGTTHVLIDVLGYAD